MRYVFFHNFPLQKMLYSNYVLNIYYILLYHVYDPKSTESLTVINIKKKYTPTANSNTI